MDVSLDLALVLRAQGRYHESLEVAQRVLEMAPRSDWPGLHNLLTDLQLTIQYLTGSQ